jgi:hypothetical protein
MERFSSPLGFVRSGQRVEGLPDDFGMQCATGVKRNNDALRAA